MMRKREEDKDDEEISVKNGLICLVLRKINVMTIFSNITKMIVNEKMEAAG